jgi:hypothetical protein
VDMMRHPADQAFVLTNNSLDILRV